MYTMTDFYDHLETRSAEAREQALFAALPEQLAHAKQHAPALAAILADVDAATVTSREALAKLPVTRKSELVEKQSTARPFGGFAAISPPELTHIFASPGPIYEPQSRRADYWRFARAMYAAGFRQGDIVHNCFAYHLTPAGSMMETGAHAIGCAVVPAGVGQTELQVTTIVDVKPNAYAGTPSFLKIILEKADEMGADVSSLKKAMVSGEALPGTLRSWFEARGIAVTQCYATADLGLISYETPAREGMTLDEGVIVEIVRPGTGDPVPAGEVGEIVVTTLNPDYPLVRFATGDLTAVLPGISPCGRTNDRIKGWMGRADQTTKVRGMFVHPGQIARVVARHVEVSKARLVVDRVNDADVMILRCESGSGASDELDAAVATSVREVCKLRAQIEFVASGELPNDGIVIDDIRPID
jgi:phenylacetate-CoA ligase